MITLEHQESRGGFAEHGERAFVIDTTGEASTITHDSC